jgi:hypothetical protein
MRPFGEWLHGNDLAAKTIDEEIERRLFRALATISFSTNMPSTLPRSAMPASGTIRPAL